MCDKLFNDGKFDEDFEIKSIKGRGSFGIVYEVECKSDGSVDAIKKIEFNELDDQNCQSGIKEYDYLTKLTSDYVVKCKDLWFENNYLYIHMESCDYNLRHIINEKNKLFKTDSDDRKHSLSSQDIIARHNHNMSSIDYFISCELFEEIVKCLQYLHTYEPPIIHRDLKPENILISVQIQDICCQFTKFCDFGYAKLQAYSGQSHTRDKGDISYMAPEVVQSKQYDIKSDIYSLGLIGQELFGVNIFGWSKSIGKKVESIRHKYEDLSLNFEHMLETPLWRKRPECHLILNYLSNWHLSAEELLDLKGMAAEIKLLSDYENKFFINFFRNKIDRRLNTLTDIGVGVGVDAIDGPMTMQSFEEFVDFDQLSIKEGDIIEIKYNENTNDGDYMNVTLWAVNTVDGYAVYIKPIGKEKFRLFKDLIQDITCGKVCRINNLEGFAKLRGMVSKDTNAIVDTALDIYEKYSNIDLNESKHNIRIHFVTKCRFGREFCEKSDSLDKELTLFQ